MNSSSSTIAQFFFRGSLVVHPCSIHPAHCLDEENENIENTGLSMPSSCCDRPSADSPCWQLSHHGFLTPRSLKAERGGLSRTGGLLPLLLLKGVYGYQLFPGPLSSLLNLDLLHSCQFVVTEARASTALPEPLVESRRRSLVLKTGNR